MDKLNDLIENLTKYLFARGFVEYGDKGDFKIFMSREYYDYCGSYFLPCLDVYYDNQDKKVKVQGYMKITDKESKKKGRRFDSVVDMGELEGFGKCYNILIQIENEILKDFHDYVIIKYLEKKFEIKNNKEQL